METALSEALHQIKAAIEFLEKIKLDKKFRKDKDDLLENLRRTLQTSQNYTAQSQTPNGSANGANNDLYNDVEVAPDGDFYNDVGTEQIESTYNENELEDTSCFYADTAAVNDEKVSPISTQSPAVFPPIPCDQLSDAVIGEFLHMKRERTLLTGGWSKKWCVLHHNVLYIYESSKDKKQKEAIDLRGYVLEVREDITREAKRKDRCFELKNDQQKKNYDFCASDKESMMRWKSNLLKTNVVGKGIISTSDTVSMRSDNAEGEGSSKPKSLFAGLKSKLTGNTPAHNGAANNSDDLYDDTQGEGADTYNDTGDVLYNDTEGDTYADTAALDGGAVYDDTDGLTYELDDKPAPPVALKDRNLPFLPPISISDSPAKDLPPPPSPGAKPLGMTPERGTRSSKKGSPLLPPRTPQQPTRSQFPASPTWPNPTELEVSTDTKNGDTQDDYENMYQGMWDCAADDDDELEFKRGEIVHVISKEYESHGWWIAKKNDVVGLVPRDYLMEAYEM